MSEVSKYLAGSVGLLRAVEVASKWQAFLLLAGGGFFALILMYIGLRLGSASLVFPIVLGVLALAALLAGVSATGIVLMDDVKGFAPRSLMNYALAGLFTLPRFLGLGLLVVLTLILYMLALALLFFLCKVPGIGAFLFAFVLPITALLTGVVYLAFVVSMLVLAAPMIWEGHGIMATLARLWTVLKERLLMVFVNWILLFLLVLVVGALTFTMASIGMLITLPLSASIIGQNFGFGLGLGNLMALSMLGGLAGSGESGYVFAGIFGSTILGFIAFTLPGLVHTKGVCLIYLAAVEGLEFKEAEAAIALRISDVKQRAEAVRERSMQVTRNTTAVSQASEPVVSTPTAGTTVACPKCGSSVNTVDLFCGSCGQHLQ